jgi:hypothetical protein
MTDDQPILTRRDEQKLLDEANRVEPPTLAAPMGGLEPIQAYSRQHATSAASFGVEVITIIRRHPIPALLLAAGLVYLLTRRR